MAISWLDQVCCGDAGVFKERVTYSSVYLVVASSVTYLQPLNPYHPIQSMNPPSVCGAGAGLRRPNGRRCRRGSSSRKEGTGGNKRATDQKQRQFCLVGTRGLLTETYPQPQVPVTPGGVEGLWLVSTVWIGWLRSFGGAGACEGLQQDRYTVRFVADCARQKAMANKPRPPIIVEAVECKNTRWRNFRA